MHVERDGQQEVYGADIVVVSAGAANSAALLLNSACERHPRGLANGSDQVGRNYMFHNSVAVLALSKEPNPTVFQKTLGVNDYYLSGPDFEFPLGNIQMVGKSQAPMFRGEKPHETLLAPNWTLRDIAHHAVDFWLSTEDLPMMDNRVTVTADGQVKLDYTATNEEPRKRLYHTLTSMLGKLGMEERHLLHNAYLQNPIPVAGVAHQAGTCRFGSDPAELGAGRRLQGARARQPVRRGHQLLPQHRSGQPGADRDGQRVAGGRAPAGAPRDPRERRPRWRLNRTGAARPADAGGS